MYLVFCLFISVENPLSLSTQFLFGLTLDVVLLFQRNNDSIAAPIPEPSLLIHLLLSFVYAYRIVSIDE